ncbi:MAG: TIGR04255 family protein [Thermodesulfobacteriota bacterium]
MNIKKTEFPSYENPPVIEVVCGVLFKSIESLLAPHLGVIWEKYKSEYPNCQEVPPLTPVIERFEGPVEAQFAFSDKPPLPRIWFIHSDGRGIIQIQRDRFLHNWKKVRPDDAYPRYHEVIAIFKDRLEHFQSFLKENDLGPIEPLQYEMTYVNHISQNELWTTLKEIGKVFPDHIIGKGNSRFLPEPEGINWNTTFVLPNQSGRLHIKIRNGVSRDVNVPIIMMESTVRGIGKDKSIERMWSWFDLAREWIVRGFADLTSEEIQKKIWRKL